MKICKIHGELSEKDISIEKDKNCKNGIRIRCRLCRLQTNRKWKITNRDRHIQISIEWKRKNREHYNEWCKQDRIKKLDVYKARRKKYENKIGPLKITRQIAYSFNLTVEQYEEMLKAQDNKCAICLLPERRKSRLGNVNRLCLDHDHVTMKIREFLCHDCNTGIGKFKDDVDLLERAISYLKKHKDL